MRWEWGWGAGRRRTEDDGGPMPGHAVSRKAATAKPTNAGESGDPGRTLMNPQRNFHEPKPTTLQIYTAAGG